MTALAQEPWCFHADQIARLTDWQIAELYLKPAAERARKAEEESARMRASLPGAGGAGQGPGQPLGERKTAPRRKPGEVPQRGDPDYTGPDYPEGTPGHRRQVVGALMQVMGLSPEAAGREYERQLAMWKAQEGIE